MSSFFNSWKDNDSYFNMLKLIGQLSNLFSESKIPYIHYRLTENIFCKYFNASNLSRSDISFDAIYDGIGIGIKTFQLNSGNYSTEKIAEFNQLSSELRALKGITLARRVSELRNSRIELANNLCGISDKLYHIVGRKENELHIFNTPYEFIDIDNICDVKSNRDKSVKFNDGINEYTFNYSKSVLMKQFKVSSDSKTIPINIIDDPYVLLENLFHNKSTLEFTTEKFVILPLYSERGGYNVPIKSGLNQWNAGGRARHENELYIPIPIKIHQEYPDFFPNRDTDFSLHLPDGQIISAKVCQSSSKALMSNPNKVLGKWILRDLMKIPLGKLVTINDLNKLGFDSIMITKIDNLNYKLSISYSRSYSNF